MQCTSPSGAQSATRDSGRHDARSLIELFLMALILLLDTPQRYLSTYRLAAIWAVALPALAVVTRRRILYM